jgi:hypothetical protein
MTDSLRMNTQPSISRHNSHNRGESAASILTPRKSFCAVLCAAASILLSGCAAPSSWETEFKPAPGVVVPPRDAAKTNEAPTPVRVREIPWERMAATMQDLNNDIATSDVHPEEWSQERKDAAKGKLLRGLQLSEDPASVQVLGRSDFRTTASSTRPDDGQMEAFARRLGATTVVWASQYIGKADRIVQEPVHEYRTGTYDRWDRRDSHRGGSISETSTTWVPVRIQVDENAFIAFFVRDLK